MGLAGLPPVRHLLDFPSARGPITALGSPQLAALESDSGRQPRWCCWLARRCLPAQSGGYLDTCQPYLARVP